MPKEIKVEEYRVGLTPASVREYVAHGHEVVVQRGAGDGIGAGDEVYTQAGARIADTAEEVFSVAEMIVKVKEPQPSEWIRLREGQILFTYLHLAPDVPQTAGLIASGCTAVAYETVTDAHDALLRRGGKAIRQEFSDRRDRAFAGARQAVNSRRYRLMLIDTLQWIEAKQTVAAEDEGGPIEEFAAALLHRRIRKLRKNGRRLDALSARQRHKVRIGAKKLRYAIDFFESLFPRKGERKQLARLSRHLKRVQDALGSLNDFVAHRKLAVDAALKAPHRKERASAFASGVVLGREEQAVKPLIKVAAKEVRGLEKF